MTRGRGMTTMRLGRTRSTRRAVLATAAAAGLLTVGRPTEAAVQAAPITAEERSNIKVIEDFIAAWNDRDATKVMAFFADDARFSVGPVGNTRAWAKPDFQKFITDAKRLKMTVTPGTTWARGPIVTLERADDIEGPNGDGASGRFVAVFTLRSGKIVDFLDFRTAARPPYKD